MGASQHGRALAEPFGSLIGGRYEVAAELGKGGAGRVVRVVERATGRALALKQLRADASEQLKALFELEYQTLASVRHPRMVEVFEYGRDAGSLYYTMELLRGDDLKRHAPIDWRTACVYLRDAAEALSVLHARKLVHRDVSPRNLWRTPAGRVKLIDLGALAPFGASTQVIGTPPFMPPEALAGSALDGRSDLYALGAVAYYLLTGSQAFPARTISDLPSHWDRAPASPSLLAARAERSDLTPVPSELDALIANLLRRDPQARPGSAAEVIDRLDWLLGGREQARPSSPTASLPRPLFVGRTSARRRLRRQLALARNGRGQSAVIAGPERSGRTRLLHELSLWSRVAPVTVLHVEAAGHRRYLGVANALALSLLDALPEPARLHAKAHAPMLAHLSAPVAARLNAAPAPPPDGFGELGVRVQDALRAWMLAVAGEHTLAVLIDDFEQCDDGSAAVLVGMAEKRRGRRLLLACSLPSPQAGESLLVQALRRASRKTALEPLSVDETRALLDSLFGEAEQRGRLVARLQQTTGGNPGYIVELCEQLVARGVIVHANGSWMMPHALPEALLSESREQARAARLGRLSAGARELVRALSVHGGLLPLPLVTALAEGAVGATNAQLAELQGADVIHCGQEGIHFQSESLRTLLLAELSASSARRARRIVAEHLLSQQDGGTLERLDAGLHLLESGDARGVAVVVQACLRIALDESEKLHFALPSIERALSLMVGQGRPDHEQAALLGPLALAGYYIDVRYAQRYGERARNVLQSAVGLSLVPALRRVLGAKLGLVVALVMAALRTRMRRANDRVPSFRQALLLLFSCVASLAATDITCLDPDGAARHARVLAPFSVFGLRNVAGYMAAFTALLPEAVREKQASAVRAWMVLAARLADGPPIKGLPPALVPRYVGGALYAIGVLEAQKEGGEALRTAERLEALGGSHYSMTADQIRTLYYAHQGNRKQSDTYRARVEQHAILKGATWQVETWLAAATTAIHQRMHDALGMKHSHAQLRRLAETIPALRAQADHAQGLYLVLRRRYAEAIPWLEPRLRQPRAYIASSRSAGTLARAYNRLGDHARARQICTDVLAQLEPDDLAFTGFHLLLQTELAIAEAGLGERVEAWERMEALLNRHAPVAGPLTLGELHEASFELALLLGDHTEAKHHLAELVACYRAIGTDSLAQRCDELTELLLRAEHGAGSFVDARERAPRPAQSVRTEIGRRLAGGSMSFDQRTLKALHIMADTASCEVGYLFLLEPSGAPRLAAMRGVARPSSELLRWVALHVSEQLDESTKVMDAQRAPETATLQGALVVGGLHFTLHSLPAAGDSTHALLGVVLLAARDAPPGRCPPDVCAAVAHHLQHERERSMESATTGSPFEPS